ncbi:hypothetical protein LCGC14_0909390 [marine sediment metagenome]|uniref:Uncharacterized protein n=1 Tax=marine sediment metagenome TaxID=412755 RepID=A0A0F9PEV8_9ZZZZ
MTNWRAENMVIATSQQRIPRGEALNWTRLDPWPVGYKVFNQLFYRSGDEWRGGRPYIVGQQIRTELKAGR